MNRCVCGHGKNEHAGGRYYCFCVCQKYTEHTEELYEEDE